MTFHWLKRWMPRGLQGRAALILLLPVVTLQLVISISFVQRHFEGVTRQMTRSVLIDLRYVAETVNAMPGRAAAAEAAARLGEPLELETRFAPAPPGGDSVKPWDLSGQQVIATLRSGLDDVQAVELTAGRQVSVWAGTDHGTLQLGFDRRRVSASNPHQLIVLIVVLGALLTLVAYLFMRNQLRPITRLAAAAAAYGKGRLVPYKAGGASEVRAAGMAFLDMRARIERQSQARRLMLSGISHDLRTPLTRLRLGLSMLPEEEVGPLVGDVDEMRRLLDAFLDFARGDAGDEVERIDPEELTARVVEDARRTGQAVEMRPVQGKSEAMPLRPTALRRALENLIGNALRYGTRCEVSLIVSPRSLRLLVEDDGPGIPEARREEAMRPFTRLDPARNQDRGTGVGLGLAIVADIAHAHGGALHLGDSERLGGLRAELVLAR
ncbi:two-component system osmolarity sensor histidine kinase EnvZ [Limimaricola soesokkakensis]|uniref:histidine kinase n=1 Tax=Limimaricola soesokkakensis TaxID=1343159 RepID=A0A1X7A578_9RHOB|nr:ATP-binding protein [Limimaricola soesokkakensis]PSK80689.1 two-component system osmolarity sensor histidine kinase EnvZ [Limimaricola soesokkakensis]SLN70902.1 Osmolarity sensor protein EnvZ [Limimaricola soesokkakensis]